MDKMHAMIIRAFGGPQVLEEAVLDVPLPLDDEILVKVHATSFNPADASARKGSFGRIIDLDKKSILGVDLSGTVVMTGKDVQDLHKGDHIYSYLDIRRDGSYAEYVCLKEKDAALIPSSLSMEEAAAVPLSALTAYQGVLELGKLKEGQRILINGATGGVGIMAIQLAIESHAHITVTCSEESRHILKDFPVDQIIDYKRERLSEKVLEPLDLVYNLAPLKPDQTKELFSLIRYQGRYVSTTGTPEDTGEEGLRIEILSEQAKRGGQRLKALTPLFEDGKLKPYITSRWTFQDIPKVHELHEKGKLHGKAVILMEEETAP